MIQKYKHSSGFTIVELLIVIVIIGILAAITIVAYNGIQERARASSVSSALSQAARKLGVYNVDNGAYPSTLAAAGIVDGNNVSYQYSSTTSTYCITATNGTTSYKITESSSPAQGGCNGHGQGGVAAISNLVPNPSFESNSTGWSYRWYGNTGGAGTNSRQTTGGTYGPAYLRKTWTIGASAADNGFNTGSGQVAVTAGTVYTMSGSMRTNRSDFSARVGVQWYDSTGTQIGATATWGSTTTLAANTWQRISANFTAPTGAVTAIAIFTNANGIAWAANDTIDFDGAMINSASSTVYADGDTLNWAWSGTPNNSVSNGPPQ